MDSNPVKKVLKNEVGVDRISDLPNPILEKILSFLPTKYSVTVIILSTRWLNLSPFNIRPIKLDLDDSLLLHPEKNDSDTPSCSFMCFVDDLFHAYLSEDVHCLESMILTCKHNYGDAMIVSWVCGALRLSVRELSLSFPLTESYSLFDGLNGCTTLVRLKLELDSELCLPDDFSLPNLEFLHLSKLNPIDEEDWWFVGDLIEGCPAVEDLTLTDCNFSDLDLFDIQIPGLKKLRMENCFVDNNCDFILNVPNLEVLILNDFVASNYSVVKFKSLLMADIDLGPTQEQEDDESCYNEDSSSQFDNTVAKLVADCSNTTSLRLATRSVVALCMTSLKLPEFQNLTSLSLGRIQQLRGWAVLACLLQNAPNLQRLCFEEKFTETEEGIANFQKSLPVSPLCLDMHMKRIEFCQFKGDENEIKLVEYFLKNGDVLQKVIILCLPGDDSILMRLLRLPRQSKTCEIEFSWRDHI